MVNPDYSSFFMCPHCESKGAIYLIKEEGGMIIVKQNCPTHGARRFTLPSRIKDHFIPYFRDLVPLCFKCGQKSEIMKNIKTSGPWTLVRCNCPTHRTGMPVYKIWNTIYHEMAFETSMEPRTIEPQQKEPEVTIPKSTLSGTNKFCPSCGDELEGAEKYCGTCGQEID